MYDSLYELVAAGEEQHCPRKKQSTRLPPKLADELERNGATGNVACRRNRAFSASQTKERVNLFSSFNFLILLLD